MEEQNDNRKATEELSSSLSTSHNSLESSFEDILARMKAACGVRTDKELASALGIKYSTITTTRRRGTVPAAWFLEVADKFGASIDWLRAGIGAMKLGSLKFSKMRPSERKDDTASDENGPLWKASLYKQHEPRDRAEGEAKHPQVASVYNGRETLVCHDCEITMVPMVEARLSAGGGSWETSADSDRRYAFRTDFLRRKGSASAMVLMRVAGDSMEPEIKDNDIVLVDTSNTTPRPGRLFAIAVEDLVYLKKVDAEPGRLILTSANPAYAPLEIDARGDLHNGIRIIGKAVWVGRELD